jgi:hypothetical protein
MIQMLVDPIILTGSGVLLEYLGSSKLDKESILFTISQLTSQISTSYKETFNKPLIVSVNLIDDFPCCVTGYYESITSIFKVCTTSLNSSKDRFTMEKLEGNLSRAYKYLDRLYNIVQELN